VKAAMRPNLRPAQTASWRFLLCCGVGRERFQRTAKIAGLGLEGFAYRAAWDAARGGRTFVRKFRGLAAPVPSPTHIGSSPGRAAALTSRAVRVVPLPGVEHAPFKMRRHLARRPP